MTAVFRITKFSEMTVINGKGFKCSTVTYVRLNNGVVDHRGAYNLPVIFSRDAMGNLALDGTDNYPYPLMTFIDAILVSGMKDDRVKKIAWKTIDILWKSFCDEWIAGWDLSDPNTPRLAVRLYVACTICGNTKFLSLATGAIDSKGCWSNIVWDDALRRELFPEYGWFRFSPEAIGALFELLVRYGGWQGSRLFTALLNDLLQNLVVFKSVYVGAQIDAVLEVFVSHLKALGGNELETAVKANLEGLLFEDLVERFFNLFDECTKAGMQALDFLSSIIGHYALQPGHNTPEFVFSVVKRYLDLYTPDIHACGDSALYCTLNLGNKALAELLIQRGANIQDAFSYFSAAAAVPENEAVVTARRMERLNAALRLEGIAEPDFKDYYDCKGCIDIANLGGSFDQIQTALNSTKPPIDPRTGKVKKRIHL